MWDYLWSMLMNIHIEELLCSFLLLKDDLQISEIMKTTNVYDYINEKHLRTHSFDINSIKSIRDDGE